MTDKTFVLELRERAMEEPSAWHRMFLRDAADLVDEATKDFAKDPTRAHLVTLNSQWSRAERALRNSKEKPEPEPPLAGSPDVEEFIDGIEEAA